MILVIYIESMSGYGSPVKHPSAILGLPVSVEKTETNCSLRMFALAYALLMSEVASNARRGATPEESFLLDLTTE